MDVHTIAIVLLGFIVGFSTAIIIFKNLLVAGTFEIDTSEHPYIFRLNLGLDVNDIAERSFVIYKVDSSWHCDRDEYIRKIKEKDLEDPHI
jgi:hypothetical protein